ncbi:hypothetical protein [Paenibacillus sp. NFR01]|uniref:hypothetical protein n=1 Tax=Paenibacillus sp. NFR01 TaxID=1566279 RepID=UPI0008CD09D8|nr:hypothetical protein [Paenibacillus sp. NFR01]SEU32787.1 hypothetical protein SAMN03159358_0155 [Paenibacillus sp. NFR01]
MYPISPIFEDYLKRYDREFTVRVTVNDQEYTASNIAEFTVENSLASGEEFEIGTAIPSKLTISLRLLDTVPENARIRPYLALSMAGMTWEQAVYDWEDADVSWLGGSTHWLPLGEFYVDTREKNGDVYRFTCYDKLITGDAEYISTLTYPATQRAVFDEICGLLDIEYDGSVVINPAYTLQAAPTGYTMRQVIGYIAGSNAASAFMGKDGLLRFKLFSPEEAPVFNYRQADYIRAKQTNPRKTYTRVVVTYNTEDGLTYEAGSGADANTLQVINPFATQAITNALQAALNGFSYQPMEMDARGFPQLDQGDVVGYEQFQGVTWERAITDWADTDLPWDGIRRYTTIILRQTFGFKGGLRMQVQAPAKSDQQSEFKPRGTMVEQINNINKTAVKQGRNYFGFSVAPDYGVKIQRDDGKSDLTLNSDVMDWRVNGQSSLYFDAQANKLKFTGALEAASGTFSGALVAATGTFTGALQAATGTFSGALLAASGSFSGQISASTILGGNVTGALIQTSEPGIFPYAAMRSDNKTFTVAASATNRVEMTVTGYPTASVGFSFTNGSQVSRISGNDGLYLYGDQNIKMESMNIYLRGYNGTYVTRWSDLKSEETGANIAAELNSLAINMTFDSTSRNLKLWSKGGNLLAQVNIPT